MIPQNHKKRLIEKTIAEKMRNSGAAVIKVQKWSEKSTTPDIAQHICAGGWPGSIDLPIEDQLSVPKDLLTSLIERDVDEVDGVRKDKKKMK